METKHNTYTGKMPFLATSHLGIVSSGSSTVDLQCVASKMFTLKSMPGMFSEFTQKKVGIINSLEGLVFIVSHFT